MATTTIFPDSEGISQVLLGGEGWVTSDGTPISSLPVSGDGSIASFLNDSDPSTFISGIGPIKLELDMGHWDFIPISGGTGSYPNSNTLIVNCNFPHAGPLKSERYKEFHYFFNDYEQITTNVFRNSLSSITYSGITTLYTGEGYIEPIPETYDTWELGIGELPSKLVFECGTSGVGDSTPSLFCLRGISSLFYYDVNKEIGTVPMWLEVSGGTPNYSAISLFEHGHTDYSGDTTLFSEGHSEDTGPMALHTHGNTGYSGDTTLFIDTGHDLIRRYINLSDNSGHYRFRGGLNYQSELDYGYWPLLNKESSNLTSNNSKIFERKSGPVGNNTFYDGLRDEFNSVSEYNRGLVLDHSYKHDLQGNIDDSFGFYSRIIPSGTPNGYLFSHGIEDGTTTDDYDFWLNLEGNNLSANFVNDSGHVTTFSGFVEVTDYLDIITNYNSSNGVVELYAKDGNQLTFQTISSGEITGRSEILGSSTLAGIIGGDLEGNTNYSGLMTEFGFGTTPINPENLSDNIHKLYQSFVDHDGETLSLYGPFDLLGFSSGFQRLSQTTAPFSDGFSLGFQKVNTNPTNKIIYTIPAQTGVISDTIDFTMDNVGDSLLDSEEHGFDMSMNIVVNTSNPSGIRFRPIFTEVPYSGAWQQLPSGVHDVAYTYNDFTYSQWDDSLLRFEVERDGSENEDYGTVYFSDLVLSVSGWFERIPDSGTVELYTYGHAAFSSTMDLFVDGVYKETDGIDLVTIAGVWFDNTTLFTKGVDDFSGDMPLHIWGFTEHSGSMDMYALGHLPYSGDTTLFIHGHTDFSGDTTLFTHGHAQFSGDTTLFTRGIDTDSGSMNLVMWGQEGIDYSGGTDLFIFSSTYSGVQDGINLYIQSEVDRSGVMNLFVGGYENPFEYSGVMNLYLNGNSYDTIENSIPLVAYNEWGLDSGDATLFITGLGENSGWVPYSGSMNLFMSRIESLGFGTTLYVAGPSGITEGTTLFLEALPNYRDDITLYIEASSQPNSGDMTLYTHGF